MADSEVRQKFDAWKASLPSAWKPTHDLEGPRRELIVPLEAFAAGMLAGEIARWIPVEEKLPPKNTRVLVWFRENTTSGPIYIPRFGEISCGHWRPEGGNGNFDDRVTHWQPLPAAPEGKK